MASVTTMMPPSDLARVAVFVTALIMLSREKAVKLPLALKPKQGKWSAWEWPTVNPPFSAIPAPAVQDVPWEKVPKWAYSELS